MKRYFIIFFVFSIIFCMALEDIYISERDSNFRLYSASRTLRELQLETLYIDLWVNFLWEDYLRIEFSYHENGNISEAMIYYRQNNNWNHVQREIPAYDESGNIIEVVVQIWDSGWQDYFRMEFTFDDNNYLLSQLEQEFQNGWQNNVLYTLTYDEETLTQMLKENWNSASWENNEKETYTYENENLTETLVEGWLGAGWTSSLKFIYQFDVFDNQIEALKQYYYFEDWLNEYLVVSEFDINNNLILQTTQNWLMEDWTNSFLSSITYDEESNILEALEQTWDTEWINSELYTYEYSNVNSNNEELQLVGDKISNYPNPFNPSTTISFNYPLKDAKLEIYNIIGQKVKSFSSECQPELFERSVTWNGEDDNGNPVCSGIYFAHLKSTNKILATKKMVLIK